VHQGLALGSRAALAAQAARCRWRLRAGARLRTPLTFERGTERRRWRRLPRQGFGLLVDLHQIKPLLNVHVRFDEPDPEFALVVWLNRLLADARRESGDDGLSFNRSIGTVGLRMTMRIGTGCFGSSSTICWFSLVLERTSMASVWLTTRSRMRRSRLSTTRRSGRTSPYTTSSPRPQGPSITSCSRLSVVRSMVKITPDFWALTID
jgi:hypothetical protein